MPDASEDQLNEAAGTWRDRGWVLVPGLVPTEEIDAALEDVRTMFPDAHDFHSDTPDRRRDEFYRRRNPDFVLKDTPAHGPAFRVDQFLGLRPFPFPGSGRLNRLVVHPQLLRFVRRALGTAAIRLYQAELWAKYAGVTDYEQPFHTDNNHSLLPARPEPGWWHLEGFLYLSDVDTTSAPTRLVATSITHHERRRGSLLPDDAPELYANEISAPGPRGSLLAYRPDVWHRATNLDEPGGSRFVLTTSFKPTGLDWVGYTPIAREGTNVFMQRLIAGSTPDELSVLGIPEPGHPVWTEGLVTGFKRMYPGLDVRPWRDALDTSAG